MNPPDQHHHTYHHQSQNGQAYATTNGKMDSLKRNSGHYYVAHQADYSGETPTDSGGTGSGYPGKQSSCCRRFVGHSRGVGVVLILIGGMAVLAQIIAIVLGAHLSYAAAGIWTGILYMCVGGFGISYTNNKSKCKLLTYTTLSIVGVLLSVILMALCIAAIMGDWDKTEGCGSFGWKRWFDSGCVENQAKIGLNFTLISCGFAGCLLCVYASVGSCFYMGWCGGGPPPPSSRPQGQHPVPYPWNGTGSLQRNGSLPRQPKPIYTGNQQKQPTAKKPRNLSSSSYKSADTHEKLLPAPEEAPAGRERPPPQFIMAYPPGPAPGHGEDPFPQSEDQPFAPQPYMQRDYPPQRHHQHLESDF